MVALQTLSLLLLLHNLFCIKRSCSVYRQVLKNIQVHGAIERVERRTLIVSDVLHGVLVLVHPNLHLPCWELFDEHVRNRNECIYVHFVQSSFADKNTSLEDGIIIPPSWNVTIKQLIHLDVIYIFSLVLSLFRKSRTLQNFAMQFPVQILFMRHQMLRLHYPQDL